jgi:lipoprotein-releasing system ATP-binding protein
MSAQPVLEAKQIVKAFHHPTLVTLLRGVTLQVFAGESIAIMGRSGEGKSTLLQILGTLDTPCQGSIYIGGVEVGRSNADRMRNAHIGFVFQAFHLLEDYSALDNVLMPARIARKNTAKGSLAYEQGCQALERAGLSHRMHFNAKLLSGGEKQRVGIARALANQPSLLLADEPSGNLDRQNSELIQSMLLASAKEDGKALVVVTHDQELAHRCDRQYELREGLLHQITPA